MKTREEIKAALQKTAEKLHKHLRMRSAAEKDFEIVLHAFNSETSPTYHINSLGEIVVAIESNKYNLTKLINSIEIEAILLQKANDLHQGPRRRSAATEDFEIVVHAFISANPPAYSVNRLGEIEIIINDKIYNLTKILEHHPDYEHIELVPPTKEQVKEYREQYRLPSLSKEEEASLIFSSPEDIAELEKIATAYFTRITTYRLEVNKQIPLHEREVLTIYEVSIGTSSELKKGELRLSSTRLGLRCEIGTAVSPYDNTIPWADLSHDFPRDFSTIESVRPYLTEIITHLAKINLGPLTEAEARSIRYLTMEHNSNKAYKKINRFIRSNGKISDLLEPNTADLRTIMFELAYLPKAIQKLRQHATKEMHTLYRGEAYETPRMANDVIHTRTKNTLQSAPGFISTSESESVGKGFSSNAELSPVQIRLLQMMNSLGVNISLYAENPKEMEVLFIPNTQKIYHINPVKSIELLAIPVRSINEIYTHNYQRKVIEWRGEIIKCIDEYSAATMPDKEFMNLVEDFCNQIAVYKAGEIIYTLQACRDFIKRVEADNQINDDTRRTMDAIISITQKIDNNLVTMIAEEVKANNIDLIQAAQYAYEHYYKYPYKDQALSAFDHDIKIDDTKIERPNHGLTHNLRKSLFMPVIVNLLKSHTTNDDFKDFLSSLDQFKMTIIQIALVFSNTGRESEVGAGDNLEAYNSYREKTQNNFLQYVKLTGLHRENPGTDRLCLEQNKFIEMMGEELRYMGNPDYFQKVSQPDFPDKEKDYLYLMLNLAHRLDLLRCFDLDGYQLTMGKMNLELSRYVDNEFIPKAMPVLYKMANDSIKVTGDRQLVVYENGIMTSRPKSYDNRFIAASTNAETCIEMCFLSNPVFQEVSDGKLNVSLPTKPYTTSPLQQAVLNADLVKIKDLLSDPSVQTEDFAFLIRFILTIFPRLMPENYEPPENRNISSVNDLNPADLIAALHLALSEESTEQAIRLIERGVDVTEVNDAGETPLYIAAKNRMTSIVKMLIKITNNINVVNKDGITPITIALRNEAWPVVYELLKEPTLILTAEQVNTIFNHAIRNSKSDIAATILKSKQSLIEYDKTVYKMNNPLYFAVKFDLFNLVEDLMKRHPSKAMLIQCMEIVLNNKNQTMLNFLIKHDHANLIELNNTDSFGNTAMHIAIVANNAELLQTLLQRGAPCDAANIYDHFTPIDLATELKRLHLLDIIIHHYKDKKAIDKLSLMRELMKSTSMEVLLQAFYVLYPENDNQAINAISIDTGKTLLHYACEGDFVELIPILLARHPEINAIDTKGETPLVKAAIAGNTNIVNLLKEHGADTNPLRVQVKTFLSDTKPTLFGTDPKTILQDKSDDLSNKK